MKIKAWHGILVLLVAVALYFLVSTREGLDNPIGTGTQKCYGTQINALDGKFLIPKNVNNGQHIITASNIDDVKTKCSADAACTGFFIFHANGHDGYGYYTGDATMAPVPPEALSMLKSKPDDAPKFIPVIPCSTSTTPGSMGPDALALPSGPTGMTGGASMTPAVPTPMSGGSGAPSYTLTCNASPVSGMTGSVGMPETPPAWNVNQPPPGHNSKNGYTLH
jgi:hypothetical protein